MLPKVDYDHQQHDVYDRGRVMSPDMTSRWMSVFADLAGPKRPQAVLDLGCGTGRLTPGLAQTFGGPVYGVEPSDKMRQEAINKAARDKTARDMAVRGTATSEAAAPALQYLSGSAERIPLDDASCDLVLMFLVLHHVQDRPAAATEIARVLRPGGRLLIRSTLSDRIVDNAVGWKRFFPSANEIERRLFPRSDEVIETFGAAGLEFVALEQVRECFASSFAEYTERLKHRAISTFEFLSEPEIDAGFARMDEVVAAEVEPRAVEADVDLMIFEAAQSLERQGKAG